MNAEFIVFLVLALVAVAAATAMVLSRNAIYAAMYLVLVFGAVAVIYILLNAPFLAVVQVSVYAGAIMVLFIFVIMLLGAERLSPESSTPDMKWQRPVAIALGILLLAQAGYVLLLRVGASTLAAHIDTGPFAIGKALFGPYLLPFEVASILLLAAMVGAVVLTRKD